MGHVQGPGIRVEIRSRFQGRLGGSVVWASDLGSGHDLAVRGFEPRVVLCADSSEPGACFGFCVSQKSKPWDREKWSGSGYA